MSERDAGRGARLRALRKSNPLTPTQHALAQAVGVSERAVQEWERGGAIKWPHVAALAHHHGVTTDEIMAGGSNGTVSPIDLTERRLRRLEGEAAALGQHHQAAMAAADEILQRLTALEAQMETLNESVNTLTLALVQRGAGEQPPATPKPGRAAPRASAS